MRGLRKHSLGLIACFGFLAVACSSDSGSPISPSPGGDGGVDGAATILGRVSSLGDNGSDSVIAGLTVSIVGSTVSAPVDMGGRFRLDDVQPGQVRLRFAGPGTDAQLDIGRVQSGQTLDVEVSVSGSVAVLENRSDSEEGIHREGVLTSLAGACPNVTFRVGGTLVRTSAATVFDEGGCAALRNGAQVRVDGMQQPDGSVQATEVEVDEPGGGDGDPGDGEVHPEGVVTGLGGACPNVTFRVGGILVRTSAATVFDDGGCAALRNGDQVRVDGHQQPDGSVQAIQVEVDEPGGGDGDPGDGEVHPEGVVTSLGGACPNLTFRVGGILVRTSAATVFDDGGCAALRNGDQVRVDGHQQPDGSVQATQVEVDKPDDDDDDNAPETVALDLEIDPDEWRLDWAQGGQGGSGGANLRARISGSGVDQIDPDTIRVSGPGGTIQPVSTEVDDDLDAEFAKVDAIGLIGSAQIGETVPITVDGQLTDGTPFSLARDVSVRD